MFYIIESYGNFSSPNTHTFVENNFNKETSCSLSFGMIYNIIISWTWGEYENIVKQNRTFEKIFFRLIFEVYYLFLQYQLLRLSMFALVQLLRGSRRYVLVRKLRTKKSSGRFPRELEFSFFLLCHIFNLFGYEKVKQFKAIQAGLYSGFI